MDRTLGNWSLHLTGLMHEAGVPIGAGTDTPIGFAIPGYSLHNELDMLKRAGMPDREILRAATVVPARFLNAQDDVGTIAVGMAADLVLVDGNPAEDIANTRRIAAVVSKGELVRDRLP